MKKLTKYKLILSILPSLFLLIAMFSDGSKIRISTYILVYYSILFINTEKNQRKTETKTKTKMMSKEELKERGWEFKYDILNEQKFQKGDIWKDDGQGAFLNIKDGKITITTTYKGFNQDGPNYSIKYNGKCNSMEQFDMICEMIELNI